MPSRSRNQQDLDSSSESDLELDGPCFSSVSRTELSSDTEVEEISSGDTRVEGADSGRNVLRERMAFHKSQGRAKSRRGDWSDSLVTVEFQKWTRSVVHQHVAL